MWIVIHYSNSTSHKFRCKETRETKGNVGYCRMLQYLCRFYYDHLHDFKVCRYEMDFYCRINTRLIRFNCGINLNNLPNIIQKTLVKCLACRLEIQHLEHIIQLSLFSLWLCYFDTNKTSVYNHNDGRSCNSIDKAWQIVRHFWDGNKYICCNCSSRGVLPHPIKSKCSTIRKIYEQPSSRITNWKYLL